MAANTHNAHAAHNITEEYIKDFFKIEDTPEAAEETADIMSRLIRIQFEHGQDICTIDGAPDGMFFLESGTAVVLSREGEQINIMHEGQYFGEYAVLANQKRMSTVRSQGRTIVYKLSTEDVMSIIQKHPGIYGEMMKKVYGQVSGKHSQLLALSRLRRGILQDPNNRTPISMKRMIIQYGIVALIFVLSFFFVPMLPKAFAFALPLTFMVGYVIITRRTVESLIISSLLASMLLYRNGLSVSYADALMETMASKDNVFTVLVMALIGSVITIIEASGAVTAFTRSVDKHVKNKKETLFTGLGIMAVTSIDDCLNMMCASTATKNAADKNRIPREHTALLYSFLPTVLCSFLPLSLWGIFVIGTMSATIKDNSLQLFCKAIPFNFYSIIVLLTMICFCFFEKPQSKQIKKAEQRVANGGKLWPKGSEKFLTNDEIEVWGKRRNLLLPLLVFVVTSLALRSIYSHGFLVDSTCGLIATLIFMFFLYCSQGLMSPERFVEYLVQGIQDVTLPIILYLLTMCFSSVLDALSMETFFDDIVLQTTHMAAFLPAVLFLASMLLTMAVGSSWAMYAIAFPIGIRVCLACGMPLPLCIGAIAAAGIAGEKNCIFTADADSVGSAVGCLPRIILKNRLRYNAVFSLVSTVIYLGAGIIAAVLAH